MAEGDCNKSSIVGKEGAQYRKHGAFCLETQKYADAVHHVTESGEIHLRTSENDLQFSYMAFLYVLQENFPSIILNPGKVYKHETIYKFDVTE